MLMELRLYSDANLIHITIHPLEKGNKKFKHKKILNKNAPFSVSL